jgi:hypothetical protein
MMAAVSDPELVSNGLIDRSVGWPEMNLRRGLFRLNLTLTRVRGVWAPLLQGVSSGSFSAPDLGQSLDYRFHFLLSIFV